MNFFPSRVKKKLTKQLFRTILTRKKRKKIPPSSTKKKQRKERGKFLPNCKKVNKILQRLSQLGAK